ncbi:MAG TPA: 16S rRNA (guanine(966)-N(2))-methyltransferase RsmD [Armatimonadota bacterium]|nr:16S rRNA (guanine(966)-N(2))-methyltransferase RsmD [Armatimonadota bacterium]
MRVIAGSAGSHRLVVPKGARLRPISDAMREALFSSLTGLIPDCRFLDVYAGTGSVGIEALSRGAELGVFIERDRRCVQAIRLNLENTGLADDAVVLQGDAKRLIGVALSKHGPFDVVFIDPPYSDTGALTVASAALAGEGLAPGGVLILQHSRHVELEGLPDPFRTKRFGETQMSFFEPTEESASQ